MTHTPWGKSQQTKKLTKNSTRYYTAGHGGIRISKRLASKIPEILIKEWAIIDSKGGVWLEEDCAANIALAYDLDFGIEANVKHLEILKNYCHRFNMSTGWIA
jgi:hypothetical protein